METKEEALEKGVYKRQIKEIYSMPGKTIGTSDPEELNEWEMDE